MTLSITHPFVSAKADGTDTTLIQPSNWNASHTMTATAGSLIGAPSTGTTVGEITAASPLSISGTQLQLNTTGTWAGNAATATLATTATTANALNTANSYTVAGLTANGAVSVTTSGSLSSIGITDTGANGANIKLTGNGATTPSKTLNVLNGVFRLINNAYTAAIMTVDDAGNLTTTANITAYSDERLKKNWRALGASFLQGLAAIKSGVYDRTDADITQVGVSAQDLQKILPDAVMTDDEGILSVAYGNAAMVAVIELTKKVLELEAKLAAITPCKCGTEGA